MLVRWLGVFFLLFGFLYFLSKTSILLLKGGDKNPAYVCKCESCFKPLAKIPLLSLLLSTTFMSRRFSLKGSPLSYPRAGEYNYCKSSKKAVLLF